MADLAALRARLKDRQVKEGALGTIEVSVCLDQGLLLELRELEAQRSRKALETVTVGDVDSLAGVQTVEADTADLDAGVTAKSAEVREAMLWLKFRAISSVQYQGIVDKFDDPESARNDFYNALAEQCLVEAWSGDDAVTGEGVSDGLRWSEVYPALAFGEWDAVTDRVFNLNKKVVNVPFTRK